LIHLGLIDYDLTREVGRYSDLAVIDTLNCSDDFRAAFSLSRRKVLAILLIAIKFYLGWLLVDWGLIIRVGVRVGMS